MPAGIARKPFLRAIFYDWGEMFSWFGKAPHQSPDLTTSHKRFCVLQQVNNANAMEWEYKPNYSTEISSEFLFNSLALGVTDGFS